MREGRVRRPLTWPLLCLLALLLPMAWGCDLHQKSTPAVGGGSTEEAERTRRMEEKAAEIERHAEEIRNMQGTDQEKMDALNKLEEERRELNEMGEEGKSTP